jgi:hypothetical protein
MLGKTATIEATIELVEAARDAKPPRANTR